jgi:hypothetical protein
VPRSVPTKLMLVKKQKEEKQRSSALRVNPQCIHPCMRNRATRLIQQYSKHLLTFVNILHRLCLRGPDAASVKAGPDLNNRPDLTLKQCFITPRESSIDANFCYDGFFLVCRYAVYSRFSLPGIYLMSLYLDITSLISSLFA